LFSGWSLSYHMFLFPNENRRCSTTQDWNLCKFYHVLFSKITIVTETKLRMNVYWTVLYRVLTILFRKQIKMAITAELNVVYWRHLFHVFFMCMMITEMEDFWTIGMVEYDLSYLDAASHFSASQVTITRLVRCHSIPGSNVSIQCAGRRSVTIHAQDRYIGTSYLCNRF
jgi:hypothetical protein